MRFSESMQEQTSFNNRCINYNYWKSCKKAISCLVVLLEIIMNDLLYNLYGIQIKNV